MKLTDKAIKAAKPAAKDYKLSDGQGLYLLVTRAGGRHWKLKYRFDGKEKKAALGSYPEITLQDAREKRFEWRKALGKGIDLAEHKLPAENSFKAIGDEWLGKRKIRLGERAYNTDKDRLDRLIYPELGKKIISTIPASKILSLLQGIEAKGHVDLAHRVKQIISQIFCYAGATERATHDPTTILKGSLAPVVREHMAHLSARELPQFLIDMDNYPGGMVVNCAMEFLLLTLTRTGETRFARWKEIDGDVWRIPFERMKYRRHHRVPHLVPLSKQAMRILEKIRNVNGDFEFIFANPINPIKPISENGVLYGIYRMGYKGKVTGHGFRHSASTILNESLLFKPDAIERQLAHIPKGIRADYNHAEYLDERRKLMQWWADYLDDARLKAAPGSTGTPHNPASQRDSR